MSNDSRICYTPDGKSASDQVPCSSREYTSCCKSNSICLKNGFCMSIEQPYVMYRGACTNSKWDQGCPEHCNKVGDPYWLQWEDNKNGQHTYCCTWFGSVDNRSYGCDGQSTFTLPDNGVLFGHALLQNVSSFNAPEVTNATNATKAEPSGGSSSREIAIGAGLGVSLGTLMLAFLAWALFERRERFRARSTPAPTYNVTHGHPSSYVYPHGTGMTKPPVELDHNVPVSEIMGRER